MARDYLNRHKLTKENRYSLQLEEKTVQAISWHQGQEARPVREKNLLDHKTSENMEVKWNILLKFWYY